MNCRLCRSTIFGFLVLAMFVTVCVDAGLPQNADIFTAIKPGSWVKINGVPQKDGRILAEKVDLLTGDLQDDDWEVSGRITRIDPAKKTIEVGGIVIRTSDETSYESGDATAKTVPTFASLRPGMLIEAEGTLLKDGTFLADEIQDETGNPKKAQKAHLLSVVGKVHRLDAESQTIEVLGVRFVVGGQTKFKTKVK